DYIHEKAGGIDLNGSIDHWDNSETNIVTSIISKDQSIFVKLMDEYASISCTPSLGIHKELRLVTKEDKEAKKTYIYSGDFDEIGWYKYYLTLVNNLKLDKKIRVLITDDSGSSGNPEDWEKEPKEKEHGMKNEIIDEFANYYNKTMTLYIGPKSKADGAYKCDITIIDEKRALIYEPEEKAEGKAIGRLTYICGDIVKEYLELFDQKNIEQAGWNSAYKLWCIEENPVSGNR
ncbi:MAG: hypothetical protein NTW84_03345, partial [Methanothrix sp.]|nr:hypothetical protein [Methanothrix sp.]